MKFVAILSLTLVLSVAQAQLTCPKYVCDPSDVTWPSNACGMPDAKVPNDYAIRTGYCSSTEYCPYNTVAGAVVCQTQTTPPAGKTAYPGEPCSNQNECIYGACTNSKCATKSLGATCVAAYECGGSLTCPQTGPNAGKCTTVIAAGETGCFQDSDCVQYAGCQGAQSTANPPVGGKCITYWSIETKANAPECSSASTTLASSQYCASGLCFTPTGGKSAVCADAVKSPDSIPATCSSGSQCESAADSVATTKWSESCGCGWDGQHYCPLFPGDSYMSDYFSNVATYLNSTTLLSCNSARNNYESNGVPSFIRDYCDTTTSGVSKSVFYSYFKAYSYTNYVKADNCVIKALNPGFYAEDAANWMVLGGLILALIY